MWPSIYPDSIAGILAPETDDEIRERIKASLERHERAEGIPVSAWRCPTCGEHPTVCLNHHKREQPCATK